MATALSGQAHADTVRIGVASNFAEPMQALAEVFAAGTGHTVIVSTGSTGRLYAQIVNGAPFDAFLAADTVRPARLVEDGLAVADSVQTYAIGRLALMDLADATAGTPSPLQRLQAGDYRRLALANPDLAPYGAAAHQVLAHLELQTASASRQVFGENIGQTYAFVATGNADLGFVALSQIRHPGSAPSGRHDLVPDDWHDPIRQDAVLLLRGAGNEAARAFLDFLASPEARDIIAAHGYEAPE
ncbi:molybdate ABC transporter substrate-binding protein [Maricaulis sp.]|uniref:molybdate ABC transporter substrate-binding protein n=1 Tax=Maricaulis sp. TaxID=1486257 RepID=UPI0025C0B6F5|nr:molybdate ABC transporter substrate-binding protein [Maricaulis sp.]